MQGLGKRDRKGRGYFIPSNPHVFFNRRLHTKLQRKGTCTTTSAAWWRAAALQSDSAMADRGGAGKVVRTDEDVVKFDAGSCEALQQASLKCLESIGYDKTAAQTVCKVHYDAYRDCRKAQNEEKKRMRSLVGLFGR